MQIEFIQIETDWDMIDELKIVFVNGKHDTRIQNKNSHKFLKGNGLYVNYCILPIC